LIFVCNLCCHISYGQDTVLHKKISPYKLKPCVDIPVVTGCAAWAGYMLTQIYTKGPSTTEQILSLDINSINPLDRLATYPYNAKMDKVSYYPFYAAFPLPLAFILTGKHMRNDFLKIGFLYLESLSITGFLGGSATYFVNQYRPYVYTPGTSMDKKVTQNAKNSFYAGHVEVIAVSTFFISEIYAGYYPKSKIKWVFFVLAATATAGMGYMRIDAGMHFPSDVLLGGCTGALSGILVPYFHNHKIIKNNNLNVMPFGSATAQGLSMTYAFNK
jgi:membrane-associated phospholipid phosphatase